MTDAPQFSPCLTCNGKGGWQGGPGQGWLRCQRCGGVGATVNQPPDTTSPPEYDREAIGFILEGVARDGLPGPRDLDVAIDAILGVLAKETGNE